MEIGVSSRIKHKNFFDNQLRLIHQRKNFLPLMMRLRHLRKNVRGQAPARFFVSARSRCYHADVKSEKVPSHPKNRLAGSFHSLEIKRAWHLPGLFLILFPSHATGDPRLRSRRRSKNAQWNSGLLFAWAFSGWWGFMASLSFLFVEACSIYNDDERKYY